MPTHSFVSYEEFGRRFFEIAVTEERVAAAFADRGENHDPGGRHNIRLDGGAAIRERPPLRKSEVGLIIRSVGVRSSVRPVLSV